MLLDDQDAWSIGALDGKGEGIEGLHNVSLSAKHPGCLWLTLQFANTLLLLDAATMGVKQVVLTAARPSSHLCSHPLSLGCQVIRCPQLHTRADGSVVRVGGPHCVRECGQTGDIWVALKGSIPCHPGAQGSSAKSLAAAVTRVTLNRGV